MSLNVKARKDFTHDDWLAIERAVYGVKFPDKSWHRTVSLGKVFYEIANGSDFEVLLVSGYLLAYQIGAPWYSDGDVFYEQLLLKVDPAAHSIRPVLRAMENIARGAGCVGIAVGTALNSSDERLARVYHRAGYSTQAHALYKELT
jgi:hypothetical protein